MGSTEGVTLLLTFRTFFIGKRVRKAKSSISQKYNKKEGGIRPIFKSVFLTIFQLLDSENYKKRYFGAFRGVDNWGGVTFWRVLFIRSQSIVDVICFAIAMVFDSDKLDWSRLCCWAFAFIAWSREKHSVRIWIEEGYNLLQRFRHWAHFATLH